MSPSLEVSQDGSPLLMYSGPGKEDSLSPRFSQETAGILQTAYVMGKYKMEI
jgi:hypothetical protein